MERHVLVVLTNAVEGTDDEFNAWYDQVHLREVLALPGFVAAQRFKVAASLGAPSPQAYLSLYEIEAEDLDGAIATLRAASPGMDISATLDRSTVAAFGFTAIGPRVTEGDFPS